LGAPTFPASQAWQVADPPMLYLPAAHGEHASKLVVFLDLPGAHAVHVCVCS
jgi:hypothetical protein